MEIKAPSGPFKKYLTLSHVKTHGPKRNITRGSGGKTTVTTFATVHAVVEKKAIHHQRGWGKHIRSEEAHRRLKMVTIRGPLQNTVYMYTKNVADQI